MNRTLCRSLALAGALMLAACSDNGVSPTAPTSLRAPRPAAALLAVGDTVVTTFVYLPATGGTFTLGNGHKIVFPAFSVCDPLTSSYGPGTWDDPCAPAALPVTIVATAYTNAEGHPRVDFQPALRFVPTRLDREFVKLFFRDKSTSDPVFLSMLAIEYCDDAGNCVDEAASDRTLRTQLNASAGMVWRRIKHFSGYNVAAGRAEEAY
ncbi:MAG TPA: hypothetical protein VFS05_08000 [Gemmatimonadaceae bacterium]|nr:hypothetical protein [Gemmatimonadaceae bacterium]